MRRAIELAIAIGLAVLLSLEWAEAMTIEASEVRARSLNPTPGGSSGAAHEDQVTDPLYALARACVSGTGGACDPTEGTWSESRLLTPQDGLEAAFSLDSGSMPGGDRDGFASASGDVTFSVGFSTPFTLDANGSVRSSGFAHDLLTLVVLVDLTMSETLFSLEFSGEAGGLAGTPVIALSGALEGLFAPLHVYQLSWEGRAGSPVPQWAGEQYGSEGWVRITTPVPEPSALALFALGVGLLAWRGTR